MTNKLKKEIEEKLLKEITENITLSDDCYDYIYNLFKPYWKKEWNKLEGEINQFSFKFFKEGFKQGFKQAKLSQKQENIKLITEYTNLKSPTSFDLFKLFADLTGFSIKELHEKFKQKFKGEQKQ